MRETIEIFNCYPSTVNLYVNNAISAFNRHNPTMHRAIHLLCFKYVIALIAVPWNLCGSVFNFNSLVDVALQSHMQIRKMYKIPKCRLQSMLKCSHSFEAFLMLSLVTKQAFRSYRLCDANGVKMLFRTVLSPIIQIYQWSGLSPFSLFTKKHKPAWQNDSFRFIAITAANLLINLIAGIHNLTRFDYKANEVNSKMVAYTELLVTIILRAHAITVLIESCLKRSIQSELLASFDEIEQIFTKKLNHQMEKRPLRTRFRKFIIICFGKNVAIACVLILGVIAIQEWESVYYFFVTCLAFYTSTLSYAQWMVYVDVIRYNIERTNDCLMEMGDVDRIDWTQNQTDGYIFHIETFTMSNTCDRLDQLRKCANKTWHASIQINRCFRWSIFVGSGNELFLLVINLYWILYCLMNSIFNSWYDIVFCAVWASMILSNLLVTSMLCEDINAEVS